jgi:hypothetical protein
MLLKKKKTFSILPNLSTSIFNFIAQQYFTIFTTFLLKSCIIIPSSLIVALTSLRSLHVIILLDKNCATNLNRSVSYKQLTKFKQKNTLNAPVTQNLKLTNPLSFFSTYMQYLKGVKLLLFKYQTTYQHLFDNHLKSNLILLNTPQFYKRWLNFSTLVLNLLHFRFSFLLFGNQVFWHEILSLNWQTFNTKLLKFTDLKKLFFLKNSKFSSTFSIAYKRLVCTAYTNVFILNTCQFNKTVYYLTQLKVFIFGLVSTVVNPW